MENIPKEIVNLVLEATSDYNDGMTKKWARDKLITIKNYIAQVLSDVNGE